MVTDFRVSVIVPSFNRAGLIGETLDSILNQTHKPAETIVVDDGSTDNTEEVVARYGTAVRYQRIENSGAPHARNVGVSLSVAPWLAFCDSDDLWIPEKLERQGQLLAAAEGAEFCFANFVHVRDGAWESRTKFDEVPESWWASVPRQVCAHGWIFNEPLYPFLLEFQPVFQSNCVMTRRFFERVGGYDPAVGRIRGEDLEFTLRCVQEAPIAAGPEVLVGVRKHSSNFSGNTLANLEGDAAILRYALQRHPMAQIHRAKIEKAIARLSLDAAGLAFTEGDLVRVRRLCEAGAGAPVSPKLRIKYAVSRLPPFLAQPVRRVLLAMSDMMAARRALL